MLNRRIAITLGTVALLAGVSAAQLTVQPPGGGAGGDGGGGGAIVSPPAETAPAPVATAPAPATAPRVSPTATLPSAESVLQGLLNSGSAPGSHGVSSTTSAPSATGDAGSPEAGAGAASDPHVLPQTEAVAPKVPASIRLREGDYILKRLGRLVKDSTGNELIVFDSDGKAMNDPPMGVIPCSALQSMEDLSDYGTKPMKFTISGQVTQYRGKNYLYVVVAIQVKDLNQGLGAGQTAAGAAGGGGK